ncbi:MAG: hypothetical protein O6761_01815 [Thaumarchaeota archaeon]|nr:hypothetical protein [Nitrososphaerota archaeon]
MSFEKRELLLIFGLVFLMIGLLPFIPPVYAIAIVAAAYFVIKVFIGRRKKMIKKSVGDGVCMTCGGPTVKGKCDNCN